MEAIVERMHDPHSGVMVRTVKSFMSKIPSVFTGILTYTSWALTHMSLSVCV